MKFPLSILILVGLLSCKQRDGKQYDSRMTSVHPYAIPAFTDNTSFNGLEVAFPVIEKLFFDYAEANNYPSIAFGIVAGGKLVYTGSKGSANLGSGYKADANSLYRIASMSKSFTAMAILKLRDEGKLDLTDPVAKYIPEMNLAGKLASDAPEVNIQHLMTMSAGFPEDNAWGDRQLDVTDDDLLDVLREGVSLSNVPGVTYEYSNFGYALLGKLIANVTGKTYQEYITENILLPLGMKDTKWEYNDIPEDKLVLGYQWYEGEWEDTEYLHDGAYGAMGGLISSIEDFGKYLAFHLDAWPPRDDPESGPISRSSVREMHQPWRFARLVSDAKLPNGTPCPSVVAYGYGLVWQKDCREIVRIGHSGGLPGFGSEWRVYPDYGIGIVSFGNRTYGAPSSLNAIALDTLIAMGGLKPREIMPSSILEMRKEQLIDLLPDWDEGKMGVFADNFFKDESYERRKPEALAVFHAAGEIVNVGKMTAENQLRGSFILEGTKDNIVVFFTLTPQKEALIQHLELRVEEKNR